MKHEFSGNRPIAVETLPSTGGESSRGRGRGRGRGNAAGGDGPPGRGRGGGGGGDHARKDKNKAQIGNHGRKRGHDKKMARGGGPS